MSMSAMLKKPAVLLTGLAIGLLVLYFAGRNGGATASGGNGFSLQSQDIATRANVAMSSQTVDYNKAALEYMASQGAHAAVLQGQKIDANTAITLRTIDSLDNQGQLAAQDNLQRTMIAGSVKLNAQKNAANYDIAKLQSNTQITLAPISAALATSLATIEASKAMAIAAGNQATSVTLANINAANKLSLTQAAGNNQTSHDITSNLPAIIEGLSSLAMFAV